MADEKTCPHCGKPVPPSTLGGICPECMLKAGLATQTEGPGATGPHGTRVVVPPPKPEEIAPLFPQVEILECLGRGGMGVVYKARQPRLNRLVALKILAREKEQDAQFAERFTREAQALARLSHPNIVTVHDFGEVGGHCYLVMEFVDGLNLRQLLQAGKMKPEQALTIVPKICEALQYAHEQGIVHRDIKPENILLDKQGRVKIADFGIAKMLGTESGQQTLTGAKDTVGTPHYMAPEQIEKPQTVDHRADIYSLGVVFYEMLTGELPLGKFQPPSKKVQVDVRLDEVVLHALEKEPERRYQQVSEVKTRVETIAATSGSGVPPARPGIRQTLSRKDLFLFGLFSNKSLPVFIEEAGKRRIYWPGLLLQCSLLGLVIIPTVFLTLLVIGWLFQVPKEKLFGSPELWSTELELVVVWLALSIVMRLAALNLGSPEMIRIRAAQAAKVTKARKILGLCLAIVVSVGIVLLFGGVERLLFSRGTVPPNSIKSDYIGKALLQSKVKYAAKQASVQDIVQNLAEQVGLKYDWQKSFDQTDPLCRQWVRNVTIDGETCQQALDQILKPVGLCYQVKDDVLVLSRQDEGTTKSDYIGQTWFPQGDSIEITSVERTTNQMTVRGHYHLASHDNALLALYVTTMNKISVPVGPNERIQISKGRGEFELIDPYLVPGLPHVSMYGTDGHPFASVYFGTRTEALAESKASWITNQATSSRGGMGSSKVVKFGPVFDRVMVDSKIPFKSESVETNAMMMIDFDSGRLFSGSQKLWEANTDAQRRWMQTNGIDALCVVPQVGGLVGLDMKALPVPPQTWNETTSKILDQLRRSPRHETVLINARDSMPPTWLFQTREGSTGILQITGFTKNPRGVKIRYRLIQTQTRSSQTTPSASSFYIGQSWFPQGDSIEIASVERTTNQMTVKGHYDLVSRDQAELALYVTVTNKAFPGGSGEERPITKGRGDFTLVHLPPILGLPHVSMYGADGHCFASLYFGTKAEALAESKASWITNSPSAATETWSPTLAPGEKPDLQKILDSAQSLMDEGSYEESLQHFLWYFDHSRNDAGQRGVRLSFALSYWIELGRRYPKAKQALLEIRDNDLRQFSEGQGYAGLFQEIAALDQYLKDDQATLTLFKMIEQRDPELAQQCYIFAENLLVQNGDYQTCRKYLGDPQAAFERIRASWQRMKYFEEQTAARNEAEKKRFQEMAKTNSLLAHIPFPLSSPPPFADQHFVNQTRQLIEILVATHDPAKAAKIQAEALAVVDDPGLRSAVSDAQQRIARHAAAAREQ